MHTFKAPGGTIFNSNSDLSGDVRIKTDTAEILVPGNDIISFVCEYIRRERIKEIENESDQGLMGLR